MPTPLHVCSKNDGLPFFLLITMTFCRTMERLGKAVLAGWQTAAMKKNWSFAISRFRPAVLALCLAGAGSVPAQVPSAPNNESNAAALLEKHAALLPQLMQNPYKRPLFLASAEGAKTVSGDAYAVLEAPFSSVSSAFSSPNRWCDVLILHLNTKYCRASADTSPSKMAVSIGKKTPQTLKEAFPLEFAYRVDAASPDYLAVQLNAEHGPLSTSNYRIALESVSLPDGKTFMHLRYSYSYGLAGRLAMQTYLSTLGRGKVGFTQIGQGDKAAHVGGMRGTVERNTMRYYLAIEAYLASLGQPPEQQPSARMQYWFDATEGYSRQLHEVDRKDYLSMKKEEYQRQQTLPAPR